MLSFNARKKLGSFDLEASFTAKPRSITALYGPSGAGKTSMVNILAGLLKPDAGRVVLGERVLFDSQAKVNLRPERRRVGCVFQDGRLFPHLSVRSNLLFGHKLVPPERRRLELNEVVGLMGIGHLLERRPATLSGGEKQRVGVGRALLTSPELLLMDEPLASLDQERKNEVLPFLARLPRELDIPIVYVSHSIEEIEFLDAKLIAVRGGRAEAAG
ncbi:MAG: molybdenum ABC transporter ATP-binding protein [Desulfarculaceae bacterium]|nr:molybdenum ABC transporter ATP-binding protein [Desulfarculaceae bacterium]